MRLPKEQVAAVVMIDKTNQQRKNKMKMYTYKIEPVLGATFCVDAENLKEAKKLAQDKINKSYAPNNTKFVIEKIQTYEIFTR